MKLIYTIFLFFIIQFQLQSQNFCEPNENFVQACDINTTESYSSFIQESGDKDYYKISVPESGIVVLDLISVPTSLNLDVFIYNSDKEEIRGTYDESSSIPYNLEVSVCEAGEYYVYIRDGGSSSYQGTQFDLENPYRFKVEFIPFSLVDECECNETFSDACQIEFDETIDALIGPTFKNTSISSSNNVDDDYYKINVTESGIIIVDLITVPSSLNLDVFIYNSDLEEIRGTYDESSSIPYNLEVSVCEAGEYYVYIRDGGSSSYQGTQFDLENPYRFKVEFIPFSLVDECECNETFSDACQIEFDETIDALIGPTFKNTSISSSNNVDDDYYKINVTESGIIIVDLITVPSSLNLDVFIYNSDLEEIRGTYDESSSIPYNLEVSVCEAGEYYVYIRDGGSSSYQGTQYDLENPYRFKVEFIPFSLVDECECNETFSDACQIEFDETKDALIGPTFKNTSISSSNNVDDDYYKINVNESGIIVVDLITVPSTLNLDVFIYNSDLEEIRGTYDESSSIPYNLEVSVCEAGEYYVYIRDGGSSSYQGTQYDLENQYRFKVEFIPFSIADPCECNETFSDACQISICEPIKALINPTFEKISSSSSSTIDRDVYAINLSQNIEYSIEITTGASNLDLELYAYDPDEELEYSTSTTTGNSIITTLTPNQSGIYYLSVIDDGSAFNTEEGYELKVGCNTVGVNEYENEFELLIYPNPFNDYLTVEMKDLDVQIRSIDLYTINGELVKHFELDKLDKAVIDLQDIASGIFYLKIITPKGIINKLISKI